MMMIFVRVISHEGDLSRVHEGDLHGSGLG